MARVLAMAAVLACAVGAANAQEIKIGETTIITFTTSDKTMPFNSAKNGRGKDFDIPMKQRDRFRFEVQPKGGSTVDLKFVVQILNEKGKPLDKKGFSSPLKGEQNLKWDMPKSPGTKGKCYFRVLVHGGVGEVKVTVTKLDD